MQRGWAYSFSWSYNGSWLPLDSLSTLAQFHLRKMSNFTIKPSSLCHVPAAVAPSPRVLSRGHGIHSYRCHADRLSSALTSPLESEQKKKKHLSLLSRQTAAERTESTRKVRHEWSVGNSHGRVPTLPAHFPDTAHPLGIVEPEVCMNANLPIGDDTNQNHNCVIYQDLSILITTYPG